MFNFLIKRFLQAIPTIFIIISITFVLARFSPSGPFDTEKPLPEQTRKALNEYYGLDKPIIVQFKDYLANIFLKGDFGPSYKFPQWSASEIVLSKFPVSLELGIYALLFASFFGILLGVFSSIKPESLRAKTLCNISLLGVVMPSFIIGPILILIFAINLKWFNAMGWNSLSDKILPSITLGLFYCSWIANLTKNEMLLEMKKPYIKTAISKGLSKTNASFKHALKNALIPVVAYLGPAAAGLITGSFVVETIFLIPGLGSFFVSSALDSDYTVIMACVSFYGILIISFSTLSDILIAYISPITRKEIF